MTKQSETWYKIPRALVEEINFIKKKETRVHKIE